MYSIDEGDPDCVEPAVFLLITIASAHRYGIDGQLKTEFQRDALQHAPQLLRECGALGA